MVNSAIAEPTLVLSPESGRDGETVTATGSAFNVFGREFPQATIRFNGNVVASNVWFTGSGFTISFSVPPGTLPGTYVVQATGPIDSAEATFTVMNLAPRAIIDVNPLSGRTPLHVHFSGARSYDEDGSIRSYQWDFEDGASAKGAEVDHNYVRSGNYDVTLTITDDQGQSGTESITMIVDNTPPVAYASADPTTGSAPLVVNFDGSQSYDPDGSIASYQWDFGDGYREDGARVSHQYLSPKHYTAVLMVTDDKGITVENEVGITVGNEPPIAIIAASQHKGAAPLTVKLDGSRSYDPDGTGLIYYWDFGDGLSGSGMTTEHTYEKKGTYQISLKTSDPHGASDSATTTIEVEPPFPWLLVIGGLGIVTGAMIVLRYIRPAPVKSSPGSLPNEWRFPEAPVNIDIQSGLEYSAGIASEGGELADISVDIRSGIWKEGGER